MYYRLNGAIYIGEIKRVLDEKCFIIKDNIYSITSDQIKDYHSQFYVGDNLVVSGAGDIDASRFNEEVAKSFGNVQPTSTAVVENSSQPYYTPSLMFQRDD